MQEKIQLTLGLVMSFQIEVFSMIREGNGTPLQYSCLENPMDGGVWQAAVHGVAKSQTQLSNFTFTFHFHALEKEMATHSSILAWRIPGMGEPGGLLSMGSHRVRHNLSNSAAAAAASSMIEKSGKLDFIKSKNLLFKRHCQDHKMISHSLTENICKRNI